MTFIPHSGQIGRMSAGQKSFSAPIDLFVGLLSLFFVKATKLFYLLMGGPSKLEKQFSCPGNGTHALYVRVASETDTLFGTQISSSEFLFKDKLHLLLRKLKQLIFRKGPIFPLSYISSRERGTITKRFLLFEPNLGLYRCAPAASFMAQ